MLPIANIPIIDYGLEYLRDAGVKDVGIVLGPIREGIEEHVGNGSRYGFRVTYINQGEPKGLAHAVLCAKEYLEDDAFLMYLGDNLLEHGAQSFVNRFLRGDASAVVGTVPVREPHNYGVVELDSQDAIVSVEEKPKHPRSNLALVGVYLFSSAIHDVVAHLRPSDRGELEITDAIRELQKSTGTVRAIHVEGWWKDTGRPEDLLDANERVLASRPRATFQLNGQVHPRAHVSGPVLLGEGSVIREDASVRGPTVIGKGVNIEEGAYVGPYTAIGDGSLLRRAEVDRSIIMENVRIDAPIRIVDSIVGRNTTITERTKLPKGQSFVIGDASQVVL